METLREKMHEAFEGAINFDLKQSDIAVLCEVFPSTHPDDNGLDADALYDELTW